MNSVRMLSIVAGMIAFAFVGAASAEEGWKLVPEGGVLSTSYELIGPGACEASGVETDGRTAWSYLPHNFNPDTAPGQCRLLSAISAEETDSREFCGRLEG